MFWVLEYSREMKKAEEAHPGRLPGKGTGYADSVACAVSIITSLSPGAESMWPLCRSSFERSCRRSQMARPSMMRIRALYASRGWIIDSSAAQQIHK